MTPTEKLMIKKITFHNTQCSRPQRAINLVICKVLVHPVFPRSSSYENPSCQNSSNNTLGSFANTQGHCNIRWKQSIYIPVDNRKFIWNWILQRIWSDNFAKELTEN